MGRKALFGVEFVKPPVRYHQTKRGVHLPLTIHVPPGWEVYVHVSARPPTGVRRCKARESGGVQCALERNHRGCHKEA